MDKSSIVALYIVGMLVKQKKMIEQEIEDKVEEAISLESSALTEIQETIRQLTTDYVRILNELETLSRQS